MERPSIINHVDRRPLKQRPERKALFVERETRTAVGRVAHFDLPIGSRVDGALARTF